MSQHLQRARILVSQDRFESAKEELQQAIAETPNNAECFSLFAICYSETGEHRKAEEAAQQGVRLEPNNPDAWFAASVVAMQRENLKKSLEFVSQAIELEPYDPRFFAQLSAIHIRNKDWRLALQAAEVGLDLDPEHTTCQNLRSLSLNRMGRRDEAGASISATLQQSPDDAFSHCNMGWEMLHRGQAKEALPHFKEALRLEPQMEFARMGVIEAMKGRYFIYRIFLHWLIICSRLKTRYLFGIIFGGYIGYRICLALIQSNPGWGIFLFPLIGLYLAFVILTWISTPLFNLLLRMNRYGRMVLSDQEKRISTWVGLALGGVVAGLIGWLLTKHINYALIAIAMALMIPSISTFYSSSEGWPRAAHTLMIVLLTGLGFTMLIGVLGMIFTTGATKMAFDNISVVGAFPFLYSAIASQVAVNFLMVARPQKGTDHARKVWLFGGVFVGLVYATIIFQCGKHLYSAWTEPAKYLEESYRSTITGIQNAKFELVDKANFQLQKSVDAWSYQFEENGFSYAGDVLSPSIDSTPNRYFLQKNGLLVGLVSESGDPPVVELLIFAKNSEDQIIGATNLHPRDGDGIPMFPDDWELETDVAPEFKNLLEAAEKRTQQESIVASSLVRVEKGDLTELTKKMLVQMSETWLKNTLLNQAGLSPQKNNSP